MILTPVNSGNFTASPSVTLGSAATAIINKEAVIANLQCVTVQDAIIYSLTFDERITYCRASDGAIVTQAFSIPYANVLAVPGTVAGMECEIASVLTGLTIVLSSPTVATNTILFTVTASTFFPPPAAQDVDSNIAAITVS